MRSVAVAILLCACSGIDGPEQLLEIGMTLTIDRDSDVESWQEAAEQWRAAGFDVTLFDGKCGPSQWGCARDVPFHPHGELGFGLRKLFDAAALAADDVEDDLAVPVRAHALGHALGLSHTNDTDIMGDYSEDTRP